MKKSLLRHLKCIVSPEHQSFFYTFLELSNVNTLKLLGALDGFHATEYGS